MSFEKGKHPFQNFSQETLILFSWAGIVSCTISNPIFGKGNGIPRLRRIKIQPLGVESDHLSLTHIVTHYLNKNKILLARKKWGTPH